MARLKEFTQNRRHTEVVKALICLCVLLIGCAASNTAGTDSLDTIEQLDVFVETWMPVFDALVDEGVLSSSDLDALSNVTATIQLVRMAIEAGRDGQQELAAAQSAIAVLMAIKAIREFK